MMIHFNNTYNLSNWSEWSCINIYNLHYLYINALMHIYAYIHIYVYIYLKCCCWRTFPSIFIYLYNIYSHNIYLYNIYLNISWWSTVFNEYHNCWLQKKHILSYKVKFFCNGPGGAWARQRETLGKKYICNKIKKYI